MMEVPQMDTKEDKVTTSTDSEMHIHTDTFIAALKGS